MTIRTSAAFTLMLWLFLAGGCSSSRSEAPFDQPSLEPSQFAAPLRDRDCASAIDSYFCEQLPTLFAIAKSDCNAVFSAEIDLTSRLSNARITSEYRQCQEFVELSREAVGAIRSNAGFGKLLDVVLQLEAVRPGGDRETGDTSGLSSLSEEAGSLADPSSASGLALCTLLQRFRDRFDIHQTFYRGTRYPFQLYQVDYIRNELEAQMSIACSPLFSRDDPMSVIDR